ncbi:D-ribose pyranase [Salinibacterium sp. NK8237]|uniref:D-ribose pyranase n=1 Tax=Salinibacterium sp. NK8237 TaxID=2792038 RepID=UPI0018CFC7D0|nr:D-ribose pyranase [Salinibacterium sp. NK8237]MBH0130186.1 D-ribose pyranase [Salinibacterium sp. NK8237]
MRSSNTTINPQLSKVISQTGHTDLIVVTDAGLPIPLDSERIDLAFRPGMPAFLDVLDTVLAELVVEGVTVSAEIAESSPEMLEALKSRFRDLDLEISMIPHEQFKSLTHDARAFVRSGEYTPYANVILHAGVAY